MRRTFTSLLVATLVGSLVAQTAAPAPPPALLGFNAATTATERSWEDKFKALPDPQRMRANMQRLAARPHNVGSPYDRENAEWLLGQFKQYGWEAHIETFQVLFPTPKQRAVELVAPTRFTARLEEPALAVDPTTSQKNEQLPTYNAYSRDGDVTAPLVYVNYGVVEDYEELERHGVSVKGAIVIARYGHSWRGIKPKLAAEHGAVGCLIYSDPRDDGYSEDSVFPQGPMRPREGVQRGSVSDMVQYPGDPLTPGIGATPDAKRLKVEEATVITRIPVLPISYGDAQPLLAALDGPVAPEAWRGGLPITYRLGGGAARVHLKVASNWDIKPIYDVIATMRGGEEPDLWVIRGNHHDAWVNGAEDPISGQVAMLEEARALGELARQGWKPKRTIVYAAWDGEEPGLLGSTEWAEAHAGDLREHGALYINSDGNDRGYLGMGGSHSLESLLNQVARDVEDPETKATVWKRAQAQQILHGDPAARKEARTRPDLRLYPLGSGSDYTAFIDHLGIASTNLGFGGETREGIYHSIYDDFYWYSHYSDTDFVYGRALSQVGGLTVMRAADADLLPYDFAALSDAVHRYTDEVKGLAKSRQEEAEERRLDREENVYQLTNDPRHPTVAPPALPPAPYLNFAPIDNALVALDQAAKHYTRARNAVQGGQSLAPERLRAINQQLAQAERKLTSPEGLPRRPWMQHTLYAPGWYTGYGAKTLPGVREAIEERRYADADAQVARVAQALNAEAALVEQVATEMEGTVQR